jgi:MFS family permease
LTAAETVDTRMGALLRQRDLMVFLAARGLGVLGTATQSVTMGWQVYDLARAGHGVAESSLYIGLLGLATFLPLFFLALPAGVAADRYSRKAIMILCFGGEALCAGALVVTAWMGTLSVELLIGIAFGFGIARAFRAPAGTAISPMLVPRDLLRRAIAWNALVFQIATILGPALAGLLVGQWSIAASYAVCFTTYLISMAGLALIRTSTTPESKGGSRLSLVREGLSYIWNSKVVLGAISLDLFAVLLGGATALLPAFARDVLHVGAEGFGVLRAAPAIGASVVGLFLAGRPIRRRAGPALFAGVTLFGVATVVFGLSTVFWLSLVSLIVAGGADMVSVYIRQTLIQIVTPDPMRGRVAAVSFLFIGASNELGEFESGVTAKLLGGPVLAAVLGGVGCLVVVGMWTRLFPELRTVDRLE